MKQMMGIKKIAPLMPKSATLRVSVFEDGGAKQPIIQPNFSFEQQHGGTVIGVDEAGCGPWAGPVVAAAALLNPLFLSADLLSQINDSKKMTKQSRLKVFEAFDNLAHRGIVFGVGQASVDEIDRINIGQATRLAMQRAVAQIITHLGEKKKESITVLVDGIRNPQLIYPTQMIKKGDSHSLSIAAASIIAKVTRDRMMEVLHHAHPVYGWLTNAGYGTAIHQKAIAQHGITPHHRRSFAPIAAYINA